MKYSTLVREPAHYQSAMLFGLEYSAIGIAAALVVLGRGLEWSGAKVSNFASYCNRTRLGDKPVGKPAHKSGGKEMSMKDNDIVEGYHRNSDTTGSQYNSDRHPDEDTSVEDTVETDTSEELDSDGCKDNTIIDDECEGSKDEDSTRITSAAVG